ncbi:hypothetical protein [Natronobiforma cellulositropha]|uniref:hypothetical protein n=1 Tax=Natronobiforma cellulositropha TaxID=1679076 RepID=UPI0021D5AE4F|nr:hypothetical protein [Natronobiforma cellulositropha]
MKTLEVTDEQYAFIQHLREEISTQVVGRYGHVRERDAVQFLIDNLDGGLELDDEVGEFDVGETLEEDESAITYDEEASASEATSEDGTDDADDDGDADEETGGGNASDDDMLDRMMNLLETHDDKWEESPTADYRYRVTLPDGTTTDVQTKDDVRAALFKNYR